MNTFLKQLLNHSLVLLVAVPVGFTIFLLATPDMQTPFGLILCVIFGFLVIEGFLQIAKH